MAGSGKPYHQEMWFEVLMIVGSAFLGWLLFKMLMPPVDMSPDTIQLMAMAKLLSEGRILDAFARFNLPPVYPILMAIVIKLKHTAELPKLLQGFHWLNLSLYFASILLVHLFVRRQIPKPYSFIITVLYAVAPATLGMVWALNAQMAYMMLSMSTLLTIDISLSKESAMGGQLSRGEIIACGACLGLSILSWQVGYLLLIAFFFVIVKRFGLKKSALILSVIGLCISPFIGRDLFYVVRSPQPYISASASIAQNIANQGVVHTVEVYADRMVRNITDNALGELNLASVDRLVDTPRRSGPASIVLSEATWLRWLVAFIAIVGAVYGLYQYTGIGTLYLCTYVMTALALLPGSGLTLAPVLPLLLFYLYFGLLRTGQWFQRLDMPVLTKITVPIVTVWIILASITGHIELSRAAYHPPFKNHTPKIMYMSTVKPPENRLEEAQGISAHRRAMDWLSKHTASDSKIAKPREEAFQQLSDASNGQSTATPEAQKQLENELSQYNYLVEEGASKIQPARGQQMKGLKLVYEDVPGRIRIWQVLPKS